MSFFSSFFKSLAPKIPLLLVKSPVLFNKLLLKSELFYTSSNKDFVSEGFVSKLPNKLLLLKSPALIFSPKRDFYSYCLFSSKFLFTDAVLLKS